MRNLSASDLFTPSELKIIVGICREDNPADVDETYGPGTYARLFPDEYPDQHDNEVEQELERERRDDH